MSAQIQEHTIKSDISAAGSLKKSIGNFASKEDIAAAFSIALVTIPLCMGIAAASGVPLMSGIFSAIIGGIFATILRGSRLTINGPAASLIVVTIGCIQTFGTADFIGFRVFLAAAVFAGVLLMILSIFRIGRYGDLFSSAIIYGIIGAIGLMILSKQLPVAFGVTEVGNSSAFESLMNAPDVLIKQNPFVGIIAILGFIVLFGYGSIKNKFLQLIPAPIWVISISVIIALLLNFSQAHSLFIFGYEHKLGPELLIAIPSDFSSNILFPDFSKVGTFSFWQIVLVITLIIYIETLISAKAMDKIDPLRRQTNVNRDLFACGLTTVASSMVGGLPVITAVPLYHGAKSKWASFLQGIILLLFVLFLPFIIREVPLAALATLLIFTGYKLASPKMFKDVYRLGFEQFVVLAVTLIVILFKGVLIGTIAGFATLFFIQYAKSSLSRKQFISYLFNPDITVTKEQDNIYIKTKGVLNFVNILHLKKVIRASQNAERVIVDMSDTRLVDSSVLEYLHEDVEKYDLPNTGFELVGLDAHESSSRHPNAMHVLPENKKPQLTKRQEALEELSEQYDGSYWPEIRWDVNSFKQFNFFQTRLIDYKLNTAKGNYHLFLEWESCDITFDQGALFNAQERHTSVILIHLPFNAPIFILQRETGLQKLGDSLSFYKDIDFQENNAFSEKYTLTGPNEDEVRDFFGQKLLTFLEKNICYHIESNGSMILIFNEMRFASPSGMAKMHEFSSALAGIMLSIWKEQAAKMKAAAI